MIARCSSVAPLVAFSQRRQRHPRKFPTLAYCGPSPCSHACPFPGLDRNVAHRDRSLTLRVEHPGDEMLDWESDLKGHAMWRRGGKHAMWRPLHCMSFQTFSSTLHVLSGLALSGPLGLFIACPFRCLFQVPSFRPFRPFQVFTALVGLCIARKRR